MVINKALVETIGEKLLNGQRILILSHIRPDGDAVGSLLGLGLSLLKIGKDVQMVIADGVPQNFRHLEGSNQILQRPKGSFDLICTLDSSDLTRVGDTLDGTVQPDINIDHHITNLNFAVYNLVVPEAVATAEILANFIPLVGLPFTQHVAEALLTGIITDTLGFRTSNMTPEALRTAANLMEMGIDLPELYRRALVGRSFEATRFWGFGLSNLKRDGQIVWTTLTIADRKAAGYPGRDDADLVNILSSIDEADIAVIFVEQPNEYVKVSWRAQPGFDVSQIALSFGGGGHPAASGAEIPGDIEEVQGNVLRATRALLERNSVVKIVNSERN
jgi:phosphoesterase RecJ-like protein